METKDTKFYGIDLVIEYEILGKHYLATYENPEEFPECSIKTVKVKDSEINILELIDDFVIEELYCLIEKE